MLTATGTTTPITAYALRFASQVRGAGNHTSTDTSHSTDPAGTGSTVDVTNTAPIQVTTSADGGLPLFGGVGLLAESLGAQGGSVTSRGSDQNGNPQHGSRNGTNGANSGTVTLTNNGAISAATPNVMQGFWALAGRSLGGHAGNGNNGQAGGAAVRVDVTTTAPVSASAT
jgi:hypothetical protein